MNRSGSSLYEPVIMKYSLITVSCTLFVMAADKRHRTAWQIKNH